MLNQPKVNKNFIQPKWQAYEILAIKNTSYLEIAFKQYIIWKSGYAIKKLKKNFKYGKLKSLLYCIILLVKN